MSVILTARGGGKYYVSVNGIEQEGGHTAEREAIERASKIIESGEGLIVHYEHRYIVDVELSNASLPHEPDPEPDFADDVTGIIRLAELESGQTVYIRGGTFEQRLDIAVERTLTRVSSAWLIDESSGKRRRIGIAWRGAYCLWKNANFRVSLPGVTTG